MRLLLSYPASHYPERASALDLRDAAAVQDHCLRAMKLVRHHANATLIG